MNSIEGEPSGLPMDVDTEERPPVSLAQPLTLSPTRASSLPPQFDQFTVGYVYATEMMQHASTHGHPEQPERISRILGRIIEERLHKKMKRIPIRPVRREEALLVHSEDHWDKVSAIKCKFQSRSYL
jgi:histone deacetylase 6